jgi:hypothetical protein
MVKVKVFFEGGVDPRSNPNEATIDNTNSLRQSFNQLLNAAFDEEKIQIEAIPAYSISNVVKIREAGSLLLIDLDGPKSIKSKRIHDNKLSDIQEFVFFMVQRMEAWILSQPNVIEDVFGRNKIQNRGDIKDDDKIKDKHPEEIKQPDDVLRSICGMYFEVIKNGRIKKMKYGKLKDSHLLIERLDIQQLQDTFEDVKNMVNKINEMLSK